MGALIENGWGRLAAILFALLATLLVIAAVGEFYGYLPTNWVDGLTSGELATLGVLSLVIAIAFESSNRRNSQVGGSFYRGSR